jgi:septum formation protein
MLILASSSPRRADLLRAAGIPFNIVPVDVDESVLRLEPPGDHVRRLSRDKADAAFVTHADAVVLAADTIVLVGGEILGKPRDAAQAVDYLARLAGRAHQVVGGIALAQDGDVIADAVEVTEVIFRALTAVEVESYVALGEWEGRAGGYAIQGAGAALVRSITGDYLNVVGLPLARLLDVLPHSGLQEVFNP